jgi:lipoprotein-releasing system ATP-binding protein
MSSTSVTPHTGRRRRWRLRAESVGTSHVGDLLCASGLTKSYSKGGIEIPVLRGVNVSIAEGEFCAIIGQSGSGKSTLLHLLATLDQPDQGEIHYEGIRIDVLSSRRRDVLRNVQFGMIFQFYHQLPELTTIENVLLPTMISTGPLRYLANRRAYRGQAEELLKMVGLSHRLTHKPRELSGGEMQRTAIARALIAQPRVLFADEPTGNLDRHTGDEIMKLLHNLNDQRQLTIVMVTHDPHVAGSASRVLKLVDNQIVQPD